jgi:hypothetical protein
MLSYFSAYPPRSVLSDHSRAALYALIRTARSSAIAEVGTMFAGHWSGRRQPTACIVACANTSVADTMRAHNAASSFESPKLRHRRAASLPHPSYDASEIVGNGV